VKISTRSKIITYIADVLVIPYMTYIVMCAALLSFETPLLASCIVSAACAVTVQLRAMTNRKAA
jgi:hypothetical protein